MDPILLLVLLVVVLALAFDYSNGFHDAANSIATIVATRVLTPTQAVAWAAFFNFAAAALTHTGVAATVGKGIIHKEVVDVYVIMACLVGAVSWNILTWYLGLPTSSSHALIGGLVGAAIAKAGVGAVVASGLIKTLQFIVIAPFLGLALGFILRTAAEWLLIKARPGPVYAWSRRLQLLSSALYSLGHGSNDAQKTMGIIAVLLVSMKDQVPALQAAPDWLMPPSDLKSMPWVIVIAAHTAIALGTLSGGWRIVKTMGMRITDLDTVGGVCAETAGAVTLFVATSLKVPVSTTHTITGSIIGVGTARRMSAVRWSVASGILLAWVLTIPAAAATSSIVYFLATRFWPLFPQPVQMVMNVGVLIGLGYAFYIWMQASRTGKGH